MIKILENSIDFSKLGNHTKEELKSEVKTGCDPAGKQGVGTGNGP